MIAMMVMMVMVIVLIAGAAAAAVGRCDDSELTVECQTAVVESGYVVQVTLGYSRLLGEGRLKFRKCYQMTTQLYSTSTIICYDLSSISNCGIVVFLQWNTVN